MNVLPEARGRRRGAAPLAESVSSMWRTQRGDMNDAVRLRVLAIRDHYKKGTRLPGVDKPTGTPFDAHGIRHSHVSDRSPDPLIFYKVFPPQNDQPRRLHFIAVATHAEAFRGNEAEFLAKIRDHLGESAMARQSV